MTYQLIQSDILKWAAGYTGPKYHAVFCDPPYHLTSIVKRFGKNGSAPAKGDVYNRSSKGFMGQTWDGGDIAFNPETWAALGEHLHDGGFGMAFASSRGWHRLAVAIEDSGMIIHPSIFGWCFLSGFPKATRIDTQVDKAAGVEREIIGVKTKTHIGSSGTHPGWQRPSHFNEDGTHKREMNITAPATELAQTWAGHRYGLQAMKPALEPIILFQKPYEGRPVDCIVGTGAGTLNIDGGRIAAGEDYAKAGWGARYGESSMPHMGNHQTRPYVQEAIEKGNPVKESAPSEYGRWPANLILDEEGARLLDEQSGESVSKVNSELKLEPNYKNNIYGTGLGGPVHPGNQYNDSGGASRMFFRSHWHYEILEQLANADPLRYEPKVSTAEREAGLDELPERLRHRVNAGGLENEPRFAPVKLKNHHPTLKPISLTKYLTTLLLPPDTYAPRRILVPFAGSGSEMIGAILTGWDEVIGVEASPEYIPIAEARLKWWSQWPGWGQRDVEKILASLNTEQDQRQLGLFEAA